MKAIMYAGIGLLSVATVYGVADFYSTNKKGTLDRLYVDEEASTPTKVETKTTVVLPEINTEKQVVENSAVVSKTNSAKKLKGRVKKIRMEDFSRARIPEPVIAEEPISEPVKAEDVKAIPVKLSEPAEAEVKPEPERKISLDKFSRAPLKKYVRPVKRTEVKE